MREKVLALALTGALLLGGCGSPAPGESPAPSVTPTPGAQEARWGEFVLPCYPAGGFHPITGSNGLDLTIAPLLYRGLFALDRQFEPREELCRAYTVSEDGLTWSFSLQEETFSDGSPLTAAEVVASLEQARRSDRYQSRLAGIVRVAAEGERVTVTLSRPNGALPALLDVPIVKETDDPLRPLGTGPYVLEEGEEGLRLRAREGEDVPLETISLRSVGTGDDLIYAFDAREISLVDTDLTGTNALGYSGRLETTDYPTTGLLYLGCNLEQGACRERAVRQAVSRAVDREDVARRLLAGHAVASALPIHPNAGGYDPTVAAGLSRDMAEAAALLEGAGWRLNEDGRLLRGKKELTLKLVVNQDNTYKVAVANALGETLAQLGVGVTVEKLPWDEFVTALKRGAFDLYLGETVLTADFDPGALVGSGGALRYGGVADAETDRLLAEYQAGAGEEREAAASRLWERLAQEAPVIPLCFKNGSLLTQWGQVSGARPTQQDAFAGLENWRVIQF